MDFLHFQRAEIFDNQSACLLWVSRDGFATRHLCFSDIPKSTPRKASTVPAVSLTLNSIPPSFCTSHKHTEMGLQCMGHPSVTRGKISGKRQIVLGYICPND